LLLADKIAVVTGGGRGIGRAIALAYARQGARVIVAARSADEIEETAWLIEETGQHAHAIATDIRQSEQVDQLVEQTLHTYGPPHIIVNSAGVGWRAPLLETSEDRWDAVHETLLKGTYLVCRAFLPALLEQRQGNIINIGAPIEKLALPDFAAYCAAKYGVEGLTRALAKELRRHGINVNALHPGSFADTRLLRDIAPEASKGIAPPESVADAALFLASQQPRGQTGSIINAQEWNRERAQEKTRQEQQT
jgi:3-oxoacyl-[acyl-carrier protein] reductase